jgi:hypothetical protein
MNPHAHVVGGPCRKRIGQPTIGREGT